MAGSSSTTKISPRGSGLSAICHRPRTVRNDARTHERFGPTRICTGARLNAQVVPEALKTQSRRVFMQSAEGGGFSAQSDDRNDGEGSELVFLIEHIRASMKLIESAIAMEPASGIYPVSQREPLYAGQGRARQEAVFRSASLGDVGAVLRKLSYPRLWLGRRAGARRRTRHDKTGPAIANHHQFRLGRALHVGRPRSESRAAGTPPDPIRRRNEHADRPAHGAAGFARRIRFAVCLDL